MNKSIEQKNLLNLKPAHPFILKMIDAGIDVMEFHKFIQESFKQAAEEIRGMEDGPLQRPYPCVHEGRCVLCGKSWKLINEQENLEIRGFNQGLEQAAKKLESLT